jgi:hypothetical protein
MARFNTALQYDQSFSVNGYQLSGVDNVQVNHTTQLENNSTLGSDFGFNLMSPFQAEITMDRSLIYDDPIFNFTGDSSFSGHFLYNGINYMFTSGYLNRYSIDCSVGDIPRVSCTIGVYGELKETSVEPIILTHPNIFIPSPRSIFVSGDETATNRVKSFTYELTMNRQPIYSIDSYAQVDDVVFIPPINIGASMVLDVYDFAPEDYKSFLNSATIKIFNISILNRTENTTILNLNIPNIQLVGQNLTSTSENSLSITNNYVGYIR